MPKKFFRVAREGKTVDNREITAEHINQMAESYSDKLYSARVWLEHCRGLFADSCFNALGDVVSLKAETDDTGRRVLMAHIDPTPELIAMNQKRQKIFTSIELQPNFSDTGKAYLTGLAVTDSPASTGTEALLFNAQKQNADHVFSDFDESDFNFSLESEAIGGESEAPKADSPSFFSRMKEIFGKQDDKISKQSAAVQELFADVRKAVEFGFSEVQKESAGKTTALANLEAKFNTLQSDFNALKDKLDNTPESSDFNARPHATGGDGEEQTNC